MVRLHTKSQVWQLGEYPSPDAPRKWHQLFVVSTAQSRVLCEPASKRRWSSSGRCRRRVAATTNGSGCERFGPQCNRPRPREFGKFARSCGRENPRRRPQQSQPPGAGGLAFITCSRRNTASRHCECGRNECIVGQSAGGRIVGTNAFHNFFGDGEGVRRSGIAINHR